MRKFDVAYYAASCDTDEDNTKFAESLELDFPILSDPGRDVAKSYGLVSDDKGFPSRWTIFIDDEGKIAYVDKNVKTGSHGADCAAKLKELGVAEAK